MPGINQLGGALSTTAAPSTPTNAEGNQSSNAQSDAGLQVASSDGVKGVSNPKRVDKGGGEGSRRNFAELASRQGADPKTGDVVKFGQQVNKQAIARALGDTGQSGAAKARLNRSIEDLFAPRPAVPQKVEQQPPESVIQEPVEAVESEDINETEK